jgi:hypothetical protein
MGRPTQGYRNAAGDKIPGTTTIIGRFKESGGLLQWAFKQGQSGASHLYEQRDQAAQSGTIAHDMIEAHILKSRYVVPSDAPESVVLKAQNAFAQFVEWLEHTRLKIIATEQAYVSEALQFGGTIDAIGVDSKDHIVLLDWKTSGGVYTDFLLQLAAYALLLEECKSEWTPQGFHLLRVSKESADFAHHYYGELADAKASFVLMRDLYRLDQRLKERCK